MTSRSKSQSRNTAFRASRHRASSREAPSEARVSAQELQEQLLERIAQGGKLCREVEQQLKQHLSPELESLIKLYRMFVLRFCSEAQDAPEAFALASSLMRPVMEWARLEEKRKQRELAEQKHRDELAARQEAKAASVAPKVLTPETLERIERELHLF